MVTRMANVARFHAFRNQRYDRGHLELILKLMLGTFSHLPWGEKPSKTGIIVEFPGSHRTLNAYAVGGCVTSFWFPLSLALPLHAPSPRRCLLRLLCLLHGSAGFVFIVLLATFAFVDHFDLFQLTATIPQCLKAFDGGPTRLRM